MQNIKALAAMTALGLAVCSSGLAQGRPGGGRDQRPSDPPQHPGDAAAAVTHIAHVYPMIAAFDANQDGQLDAGERHALGQAMLDGTVEAPNHRTPPEGVELPHPGVIIRSIAMMYRVASSFDADRNGSLSEDEQAALKGAIENGKVQRPGGQRGGRPPGVGGRPF